MKRIFLLLIISSTVCFGQVKKDNTVNYIHFSPSTVIEPFGYMRLGISRDITDKHNIQLDLGFGKNLSKNNYSRYYIKAMYKYYTSKPETKHKFYLFADMFYNKNNVLKNNSNYLIGGIVSQADTTTYITYTKANMHINKIGCDIGFGYLIKTYKQFYINIYSGIGLANRTVSYKNMENKKTEKLQYQGAVEWFDGTRFFQAKSLPVLSLKGGIEFVYNF
jgi:hypothetical protein